MAAGKVIHRSLRPLAFDFVPVWIGLALAVVASGSPARAIDARPTEYHTRTWTTDDGLPHNNVNAVLQDSTGFMWFGTAGGLARFDGREFREMNPPAEFRANGFNIRGVAEERPGVLVVVPAGNTVLRLSGAEWSVHPLNAALAPLGDPPVGVYGDSAGTVWVATASNRLVRWNAAQGAKVFGGTNGLASRAHLVSLATDSAGRTWVNGDGLWVENRSAELVRVTGNIPESRLVGPGRNGRVWLIADRNVCALLDGKIVSEFPLPATLSLNAIRSIYEDRSGAVWIASSRQGLYRLSDGQLARVATFLAVSLLTEDREGNIWVATDGNGIAELREKAYRLLNTAMGLPQNVVSSVAEDATHRVWLANRSGGLFYVGADLQPYPIELTGPRMFANVVCADAQNQIWFGGGRNGLSRWTPGTDRLERLPTPVENLHILFRASDGSMWFASDAGDVGYYLDGEPHLADRERFRSQLLRAIAEDADGSIWLGGRGAQLLRTHVGAVDRCEIAPGFPHVPIDAICADGGKLWIGTPAGLILKEGDRYQVLTAANGLADDIVQGILDDGLGFLWFTSRRGLFYIAKSDLLATAHNPAHRVESHRLGPNQGLIGVTPTPNYCPTSLRSQDGLLWFATAQGAIVVDPARLPHDLPPPPVLIDAVKLDGTQVAKASLRIPSGRHRLEFRFAALSYTAPEGVALRHRLESIDQQWIDTPVDRTATYTNLTPGNYTLHVIARNSSGTWNDIGATLAFVVVPAWWETLTFRISAGIFMIGFVATVARTIVQRRLQHRLQQLEQQHALEKERSRIARDLHDELGAGLTEVGLLADRLVVAAPDNLGRQLSGLAWRTRRLATDLSGIVWTMNAQHSSLDHLAVFLRRYAERLFRNTGTRCSVHGVDGIPAVPLPPDVQHHLLAVTKEALNNILKHAAATEAIVRLQYTDGRFELRISDNGVGCTLDPTSATDGNGLRNMRARIAEIGGTFEISGTPGSGTEVQFRVPLPAPKPHA